MQKIVLITGILLFSLQCAVAQPGSNKDELQKQRQQLKKEIEETEKVLNETRSTTKVNVGQLNTINKRIDLQGNVIENITGQLRLLENDIYRSQKEVTKLARALDTLKQEYAKSMVYSYKNRNNYDFLNFIFSASSFNDAIKRVTYLRSYRTYREMQGENISRTQDLLQQRINELSGNKQKKNIVLQEKGHELAALENQQQVKEQIVAKLKGRQKELTAQMNIKRKQDAKLKGMITAMIRIEIENARKKAEEDRRARERLAALNKPKANPATSDNRAKAKPATRETKNTGSVLVTSEADRVLDANFERNRGSLPWPVDGFIINHFGANQLPGGIDYNNPGVSIGTKIGSGVKSVFDGEVTRVSYMDDKQVVFIKHGKYFTVYSNLSSADVKRGQAVKTGQEVGKAGSNDDGQGQVDLIIMKETNNVNPEQWLRRK